MQKGRQKSGRTTLPYDSRLKCLPYVSNTPNHAKRQEDNLQDGFIKVLESIGQYKGKGSFEGWMKRIFINTALEKFRKNRSVQVVEEVPEVVDEDDVDDDMSIPPEVLFEFVNQLPEKYRLVFNLYVMEDMQHKEICSITRYIRRIHRNLTWHGRKKF